MSAEKKAPAVIAVCGVKNSGKTTLIEKLLPLLTGRGLRVAVIKHDGHDFACDVPGTDSARFAAAGAYGTAVWSSERMFVHRQGTGETEADLIRQFPEADLILLEGGKNSNWPKLELVRSAVSGEPVSDPSGRFLLVTDLPAEHIEEASLPFEALQEIAERILRAL